MDKSPDPLRQFGYHERMQDITIRPATSSEDFDQFGRLCRQYVSWCRERYAGIPWFVDEVFGYQSLDEELHVLATKYAPPLGRTLLITLNGETVGGGAYRRSSDTACEMKRLYVVDRAKGHGLGQRLIEALLRAAYADGFRVMQLDTGNLMTEALALYLRLGFTRCEPYIAYPERLMPYLVFLQKDLKAPEQP